MKSNILIKMLGVLFFSLLVTSLTAQVKIGDNPSTQAPSAILELEKTNMGLLITRVNLADIWDNSTIESPANSLLVFNENYGGEGSDAVSPGFYYWREDEGRWIRLQTGSGGAKGDVWIDDNYNILSRNSANQNLQGIQNVVLGEDAFNDLNGASNKVIAIGYGAAQNDITSGDASLVAIGFQPAMNNGGTNVIALGENAGLNNQGNNVNAFGFMAAQNNLVGVEDPAGSVNALGDFSAANNTGSLVNAFGGAAGENNSGWSVNVLGNQSGQFNEGAELNAMGAMSAQYNTAAAVNVFGREAARYNTGYGTNAFGDEAAKFNDGDHAVAISEQALHGDEFNTEGPADGSILINNLTI